VSCNGTRGLFTFICPHQYAVSKCRDLPDMLSSNVGSCSLFSYTSTNTTCKCTFAIPDLSTDSTSTVNVVAMLDTVLGDFTSTWTSANDLSMSTIKNSWEVLITIGSVGLAVVLGALLGYRADTHDNRVITPNQEHQMMTKTLTQSNSVKLSTRGKGRVSSRPLARKQSMLSPDIQMIESSLPPVLSSKPFIWKFAEETRRNHRWLGVIFFFSPHFSRVLRVVSLGTNIIVMLFMEALLYNVVEIDDGTCETHSSLEDCLKDESTLARGESKCYWTSSSSDAGAGQCRFREPSDDFKRVLIVAILSAALSAPLALTVDWLIFQVLAYSFHHADNADEEGNEVVEVTRKQSTGLMMISRGMKTVLTRHHSTLSKDFFNRTAREEMEEMAQMMQKYRLMMLPEAKADFDGKCKESFVVIYLSHALYLWPSRRCVGIGP
jgi:hypothetical protein